VLDGHNAYFSVEQTADLTDLGAGLLRRWDNDDIFHPAQSDPNRKRPMSRLYSFRDVVTLRTLAQAREFGVSGRELRKVARFVEEHPETSWDDTQIYILGHKVFFSYTDVQRERHLLASKPLGQQAMPKILTIDIGKVQSDAEQRLQQLIERTSDQIGKTEQNRFVVGGAEVFAGTRIPVETVAELLRDGWSSDDVLANFPRLTKADLHLVRSRAESAQSLLAG
jgi:uncharacterized protein (DUF433 family)